MDIPDTIITQSAEETADVGQNLGASLKKEGNSPTRVVCLRGELGSGKTTFVQGLAKGLGIPTRLLSPTYIIVRPHKIPDSEGYLYHLDLYRLEDGHRGDLGFSEFLSNPHSIVAIEWPEKLGISLPKERIDIAFSVLDDGTHQIQMHENHE